MRICDSPWFPCFLLKEDNFLWNNCILDAAVSKTMTLILAKTLDD